MAKGPRKRMLCQRWEGRQSLCEGSGVSGDRFARRDSPIHLSLTLTQGPGVSSQLVVKHPTPPPPPPLLPPPVNLQHPNFV